MIGSLFSGYGGLDLAVETVTGERTAWVSDIDPGACRILAERFPGVPNLGDITGIDWSTVPPVRIITGGFPCQDVSMAGRRAGLALGSRSGLWSMMAGAVDALRPDLVVAENVRGLLSADGHADVEPCPWCMGDPESEPVLRALGAVLGDLADVGYDAAWQGVTAASVGAPHGRFRVFIIAWPSDPDRVAWEAGGAFGRGRGEVHEPGTVERTQRRDSVADADADGDGFQFVGWQHAAECDVDGCDGAHTDGHGAEPTTRWGPFAGAVGRWATVLGRPAPDPTLPGPKGGQRLSPRFVEWMMGLDDGWVTDVPGLTRNQQLKALGNGVVPQQAAAALRVLLPIAERYAA
jgi:DNA (cytosine-5)-methyltransferase 1